MIESESLMAGESRAVDGVVPRAGVRMSGTLPASRDEPMLKLHFSGYQFMIEYEMARHRGLLYTVRAVRVSFPAMTANLPQVTTAYTVGDLHPLPPAAIGGVR